MCMFQPPIPERVLVLGDGVFKAVIKLTEVATSIKLSDVKLSISSFLHSKA